MEHPLADAGYVGGNGDASQAAASTECRVPDSRQTIAENDGSQVVTATERIIPKAGYVVGDYGFGQPHATGERRTANCDDAVRYFDFAQVGAARERQITDSDDTVGDGVVSGLFHRAIEDRGLISGEQDAVNTAKSGIEFVHRDIGQAPAVRECLVCNIGHSGWYCDLRHVEVPREHKVVDGRDRQSVDGFRDGHDAAGPGVTSDGDTVVFDDI